MGTLIALAPVAGTVVDMADVPDPVFSAGLVGSGLAIAPDPSAGRDVVSPVSGTVVKLHPHAFVVADDKGRAVLVHLGIDTVQLHGVGFTTHIAEGDTVAAGQLVIGWDPAAVERDGWAATVPVVALDAGSATLTNDAVIGQRVHAGDPLFRLELATPLRVPGGAPVE